jgi:hypothetical protein
VKNIYRNEKVVSIDQSAGTLIPRGRKDKGDSEPLRLNMINNGVQSGQTKSVQTSKLPFTFDIGSDPAGELFQTAKVGFCTF